MSCFLTWLGWSIEAVAIVALFGHHWRRHNQLERAVRSQTVFGGTARMRERANPVTATGGAKPTTDERVTRLETQMSDVQDAMGDIRFQLLGRLSEAQRDIRQRVHEAKKEQQREELGGQTVAYVLTFGLVVGIICQGFGLAMGGC